MSPECWPEILHISLVNSHYESLNLPFHNSFSIPNLLKFIPLSFLSSKDFLTSRKERISNKRNPKSSHLQMYQMYQSTCIWAYELHPHPVPLSHTFLRSLLPSDSEFYPLEGREFSRAPLLQLCPPLTKLPISLSIWLLQWAPSHVVIAALASLHPSTTCHILLLLHSI